MPQQAKGEASQGEERELADEGRRSGNPVDGQRQHHVIRNDGHEFGQRIGPGQQGAIAAQGQGFPHAAPASWRLSRSCGTRAQPQLGTAQDGAEFLVVGHGDHGRSGVEQFGQERGKLRPGVRVLAESGFVQHQDLGVGGQHRGHGQPPLFPAGERVRVGVNQLGEPQPLQQFVHPLLAVAQVLAVRT